MDQKDFHDDILEMTKAASFAVMLLNYLHWREPSFEEIDDTLIRIHHELTMVIKRLEEVHGIS